MTAARSLVFLCTALILASCSTRPAALPEQQDLPKIDIHTHYTYDRDYLTSLLDEWNMRAVVVDVSKTDTDDRSRWNAMVETYRANPDQLLLCTAFDADGIDDPNYASETIEMLREDFEQGAVMVKVWKNFGMVSKDASENYVQIDDERLQPIWDFLTAEGIPVIAHIGEPRVAWLPLEGNEGSPHYSYYVNNPEYHAYKHPEIPRWEDIMEARDNWLAANPDLVVIGAHLGSMAYDVDVVAERLDAHANFFVDTAARFGDLTSQDSEKVRAFFIEYADRILYGTDMGIDTPLVESTDEDRRSERESLEKMLRLHWTYFTSSDSLYFDSPMISSPVDTRGLNLPEDVLRRIYHDNSARLLGL